MQTKTISKIIRTQIQDWLDTIKDEPLKKSLKENIIVTGGSITSLFLKEKVNDFDIYLKTEDIAYDLANYYLDKKYKVYKGSLKEDYLSELDSAVLPVENNLSSFAVFLKNLNDNQVKIDVPSKGVLFERKTKKEKKEKYVPLFLSRNALTLTNNIQIIFRFTGDINEIHKNFDFIHATNYWTFDDGLVTNIKALESILTKQLYYNGSLYPLTSIFRMKKFTKRGWNINAGQILKILLQISDLDLKDVHVLEEQLMGIDIAIFSVFIQKLISFKTNKESYDFEKLIDELFESEFYDDSIIEDNKNYD